MWQGIPYTTLVSPPISHTLAAMPQRFLLPLCTLIVIVAAWLPRGLALDVFVTPDEPRWLTRSANFYQALSTGDFAQTYQREHPGVTVMWAGTLAFVSHFPDYPQLTPGPFHPDETTLERWLESETDHTALELLAAARWWIVTWISLLLGVAFLLLWRLFGLFPAFFISLWMAFEPFYIALSRELHLDGLLTSLLVVALLAWLLHLRAEKGWGWVALSGLFLGLAGLTKVPAVALALFGVVGFVWEAWRGKRGVRWAIESTVLWGGIAIATVFALWPTLWVAPLSTLQEMATVLLYYAEEGHGDGVFFLGEISRNPGWLYYPVVYAFRTQPYSLLMLVMSGIVLYQKKESVADRRAILWLLGFALFFVLFISISAKQQERYLLPTIVLLGGVTAWGVVTGLRLPTYYEDGVAYNRGRKILFGLFLFNITLMGVRGNPYYFNAYNMVLGYKTAPSVLTVGWGEGLDQAAAHLNEREQANQNMGEEGARRLDGKILSWYDNGPLSYFLNRNPEPLSENWEPAAWCNVDYVVSYVNMWQRELPTPEVNAYLNTLLPEEVIVLESIEYARVYDVADVRLPDFAGAADDRSADFGGLIRLLTVDPSERQVAAGETVPIILNLQSLTPMTSDYNILVKLVAPDGQEVWREEGFPWGAPTSNWEPCTVRPDGHEVLIPADAIPGDYRLTIEFYDPATFAPLPVTAPNCSHSPTIYTTNTCPPAVLSDRAWDVGTITVLP